MFAGVCVRPRPFEFTLGGSSLDPLGSFDFVNDTYTWGATSLTAADVTDKTAWITANGLEVPASSGTSAELLYSQATTFLADCQWTMVIDVDILSTSGSPVTYLFTETNSGEGFFIQVSFAGEWDLASGDGNTFPVAFDGSNISTGVHRFAVTQTDAISMVSIDGAAAQSDTTGVVLPVGGFPMVNFFMGGYSTGTGRAVNIRKIKIYDAVTDAAQLQSLS